MSRSEFLPVAAPNFGPEEEQEVLAAMASGWVTTGPRTKTFEQRLAQYTKATHAVCVSSCTAALHLALEILELQAGDEVITTPLTFCATTHSIIHAGGRVVLADVEPDTLNLDPDKVEAALTPKTRAILPVHYGGHPCEMDRLMELANARGIAVIEDAAHAIGATYRDRQVGSIGSATAFSFYATKNLSTGEGGALTTNDEHMADRARVLSLHGMSRDAWKRNSAQGSWYYEVVDLGFKYNMSDISAALGLHQLDRLAEMTALRRRLAAIYDEAFDQIRGVRRLIPRAEVEHARHLYPILLDLEALTIDRNRFIEELRAENIGTTVNFIPIHFHPYYRATTQYREGDFPVTEDAFSRLISLPLHPRMNEDDAHSVIEAVEKIAKLSCR